jgi:TIR domain-containing protein
MNIFLSWSGNQSHLLAQAFKEWLPEVIQSVKPFLSSKDISAGVQWFPKLKAELEAADFGIVCLTRSNLKAEYIMLESGAMAMRVEAAKLVPVLCDISEAELGRNPLTAFNYVHLTPEGVFKLIESINNSLVEKVPEVTLKKRFDRLWPELRDKINTIIATPDKETSKKKVNLEDSVEVMLSMLRVLVRKHDSENVTMAQYLFDKKVWDDWIKLNMSDLKPTNTNFARAASPSVTLGNLIRAYVVDQGNKENRTGKDLEVKRTAEKGSKEE